LARSIDGGLTWSPLSYDAVLVEPICQASLLRYDDARLLFSNPASRKRERMALRLSEDDGRTWLRSLVLHEGPAAYSCLTVALGGMIGCLYECGDVHPYERIRFARVPPDALKGG
ncbi:MAG: exo-alpha-sialidase, partial [Armatimonadetes bacterium]|nr:exo-alpha-sialidase [Armatimonadota bacterium]